MRAWLWLVTRVMWVMLLLKVTYYVAALLKFQCELKKQEKANAVKWCCLFGNVIKLLSQQKRTITSYYVTLSGHGSFISHRKWIKSWRLRLARHLLCFIPNRTGFEITDWDVAKRATCLQRAVKQWCRAPWFIVPPRDMQSGGTQVINDGKIQSISVLSW